jgi:hypothetical protein
VVGLTLFGFATFGHAELLVEGSRDRVIVKADQVPLNSVIDALANRFNVTLRSPVALDGVVNGRYSGSLTAVLARLLRSYDFVLGVGRNREADPISIVVLGQSNNTATPSALVRLQPPVERIPVGRRGDGGL